MLSVRSGVVKGFGREMPKKVMKNIVVDTINLTYFYENEINIKGFTKTIVMLTKKLRDIYGGIIFFVLKDRDTHPYTIQDIEMLNKLAHEQKISISVATQYDIKKLQIDYKNDKHCIKSRDDFYMCMLSTKYNCDVLTGDKLRDYREFKHNLKPFLVYSCQYWTPAPVLEIVNPKGINIKSPKIIFPITFFKTI
jgi:hypothetical protein